jgi:hypothetical protein
MLKRLWLAPVRWYQRWVSPLTPPSCRYSPSCSQYAIEAVERRGIVRGSLLALWRLLRCNPLLAGGHDPVPNKRGGS